MIDVVDVLGTRNDNVSKNVNKWAVNQYGEREQYVGRNKQQKDLDHDTHHDLERLHENGISYSVSSLPFLPISPASCPKALRISRPVISLR